MKDLTDLINAREIKVLKHPEKRGVYISALIPSPDGSYHECLFEPVVESMNGPLPVSVSLKLVKGKERPIQKEEKDDSYYISGPNDVKERERIQSDFDMCMTSCYLNFHPLSGKEGSWFPMLYRRNSGEVTILREGLVYVNLAPKGGTRIESNIKSDFVVISKSGKWKMYDECDHIPFGDDFHVLPVFSSEKASYTIKKFMTEAIDLIESIKRNDEFYNKLSIQPYLKSVVAAFANRIWKTHLKYKAAISETVYTWKGDLFGAFPVTYIGAFHASTGSHGECAKALERVKEAFPNNIKKDLDKLEALCTLAEESISATGSNIRIVLSLLSDVMTTLIFGIRTRVTLVVDTAASEELLKKGKFVRTEIEYKAPTDKDGRVRFNLYKGT